MTFLTRAFVLILIGTTTLDVVGQKPLEDSSKIAKVKVIATFEDGRPVKHELVGLSESGYGIPNGWRTNSKGTVSLPLPRGKRFYVMGYRQIESQCLFPISIGPRKYPPIIHAVFSSEGCREDFNLVHRGMLHASVKARFTQVTIAVTYPDGRPAEHAQVSIISNRKSVPFVSAFLTNKQGLVQLPIPKNQEFHVDTSIHDGEVNCDGETLNFNTEHGILWRPRPSADSNPRWNEVSAFKGQVRISLRGDSCSRKLR
jgi:hypothetical protein